MTTKENVGTGTDTATTTPRPQDEKIISVDFYVLRAWRSGGFNPPKPIRRTKV